MFTISFATDNAAFHDDDPRWAIARTLEGVGDRVIKSNAEPHPSTGGPVSDVNGNIIGSWKWER